MMFKSNQKIILIIFLIIILVGVAFYWTRSFWYHKSVPEAQKNQIQADLVSNFKEQQSYSVSSLGSEDKDKATVMLNGNLAPNGDFQGKYEINQPAQKDQPAIKSSIEIIKIGTDVYIKEAKDDTFQKKDSYSIIELNILAHPEDIQIQSQLADQKIDGVTYSQYNILFEKPDQEIIKTMSQEQLDNLRISGTILVRKDNFQLKQMKLHQGKDDNNSFTIDYSVLDSAPKIEVPKI